MKDIEIVVFNDKSWVRFTEYQKLDEKLKQERQSLAKRICELQYDLSKEKSKNEELIKKLDKQYETCPYRSTDMGCDYCDYRDRNLKEENE